MDRNELMREVQQLDEAILQFIATRCSMQQLPSDSKQLFEYLAHNLPREKDFTYDVDGVKLTDYRTNLIVASIGAVKEPKTAHVPARKRGCRGNTIRSMRGKLGWTQQKLADELTLSLQADGNLEAKVTASIICRIENGANTRTMSQARLVTWLKKRVELESNPLAGSKVKSTPESKADIDLVNGHNIRTMREEHGMTELQLARFFNEQVNEVETKECWDIPVLSDFDIRRMEKGQFPEGVSSTLLTKFLAAKPIEQKLLAVVTMGTTAASRNLGKRAAAIRVKLGWSVEDLMNKINEHVLETAKPITADEIEALESGATVDALDPHSLLSFLQQHGLKSGG